jgi:hypothetical protein
MAESQPDRLKRELRFLKESYEAGIISEDEFNKGKSRIEGKLAEWGEGVVEEYKRDNSTSRGEVFHAKEDRESEAEEEEKQEKIEVYKNEQTNNKNYERDTYDTEDEDNSDESVFRIHKKPIKEAEIEEKEEKEEIFEDDEFGEEESKGNFWVWFAVIALIAALAIFFFINQNKVIINTDLVILNDKNCQECDTRSAESVIEKLFPDITKSYIDYNDREGKTVYTKLGIDYMPAYIFKQSIEQTDTWKNNEGIRGSFDRRGEYWLLKPDQTDSKWKPN